jgi:Uma2 family endonuclease
MSTLPRPATLDDLYQADGKAELVGGRLQTIMPTGFRPGQIGLRIARSLDDHAVKTKQGVALPDNVGFVVPELSSGRQSFSPDAAWHAGALPDDEMDFIDGAPTFAVEVRSKGDYGPAAEAELAAKRADYFEAGTRVVWDVDPEANRIRSYSPGDPDNPVEFTVGQIAHAEPAVKGWRLDVRTLFE